MTYSRRKKSRSKNRRKSLKRKTKKRKRSNRRRRRRGGGGSSAETLNKLKKLLKTEEIAHKLGKIWKQVYKTVGPEKFNLPKKFQKMSELDQGKYLAKEMKNINGKFWKKILEIFDKNPKLVNDMRNKTIAPRTRPRRQLSRKGGGNGRETYQWTVWVMVAMMSTAFMSLVNSFLREYTGQGPPSASDELAAGRELTERLLEQDYEGVRTIIEEWLPWMVFTGIVGAFFTWLTTRLNRYGPHPDEQHVRRRPRRNLGDYVRRWEEGKFDDDDSD